MNYILTLLLLAFNPLNAREHFTYLKYHLWVRDVYDLTQALSGLKARAEEVVCQGRMIEGQGVKGNG